MNATRALRASVLVVAVSLVAAGPAAATPSGLLFDDLEQYLKEASGADYAGTQIVVTVYQGKTTAGVVSVAHAGEMLLLSERTVVGDGKVSGAAEGTGSIVISDWNRLGVTGRYTTGEPENVRHLGRKARSIAVMEGELLRAQIVFDAETNAPLATQVFNTDGSAFRQSWMFQFDPTPSRGVYERSSDDGGEYTVMLKANAGTSPGEVVGYRLGDRYSGPDDVVQSFYSDGLFSFSLFEIEGAPQLSRFDDAVVTSFGGAKYDVLVTPAQMWVRWTTPGTTYVLVGDLPPDHLRDVLAELPRPRKRNLLSRLWRGLFG